MRMNEFAAGSAQTQNPAIEKAAYQCDVSTLYPAGSRRYYMVCKKGK